MDEEEELKELHRKKTVAEAADKTKLREAFARHTPKERTVEEERDYLARLERLKAAFNKSKEKKVV